MALPRPDALESCEINGMVMEGVGDGDLSTGNNKRATFDLHFEMTSMLLT